MKFSTPARIFGLNDWSSTPKNRSKAIVFSFQVTLGAGNGFSVKLLSKMAKNHEKMSLKQVLYGGPMSFWAVKSAMCWTLGTQSQKNAVKPVFRHFKQFSGAKNGFSHPNLLKMSLKWFLHRYLGALRWIFDPRKIPRVKCLASLLQNLIQNHFYLIPSGLGSQKLFFCHNFASKLWEMTGN